MSSCKPGSSLCSPAARLPAAASHPKSLISGAGRPLLGATGGGATAAALWHRQGPAAARFRQTRSNALLRSAALGSSADGQQASAVDADGSSSSSSSSPYGTISSSIGSSKGSSNSSSSSSSSAATSGAPGNGSGRRRREPCLPPLPFWVAGVSVVGLPDDQLVFGFLTPSEAAAAARRQLRPEAPYGPSAIKLATLQGDRVQAVLDRWQYAIAQQELASFDARPMLWWRYETALRSAASGGNGSSGDGSGRGGGSGSGSYDEAAAVQEDTLFSKRQLRRMARAAKAAAKAGGKHQTASPSRRAARDGGGKRSKEANGRSGSGSSGLQIQQVSGGLALDPAAFQPSWQVCTLRGLPDGTIIYKFGDDFEPVVVGPEPGSAAGSAAAAAAAADADAADAAADAAGMSVAGFTSGRPPGGEAGTWWRQEQRPELGKLLWLQEQQRSMEGVPFSSALRLGARFNSHANGVLRKLQAFASEYEQRQRSSVSLGSKLHPTYEQALAKVQRAQLEGGHEQQKEAEPAQLARRERQQQQEEQAQGGAEVEQAQRQVQQVQQQQGGTDRGRSAALLDEQPFKQRQEQQQQAEQQQQQQQQQQVHRAAARERLEPEAASSSSSGSSSSTQEAAAEGVAEEASEEETQWRAELLPRPQWQPPAAEQPARPAAAQADGRDKLAAARSASPAAEQYVQQQQQRRQQQQQAQQPAAPRAQLAALAAAVGAAVLRVLRPALLGITAVWLALWRLLPVALRRLFWRNWPPQWPGHLSPAVRQLLLARRMGAAELRAAGFNADGHSAAPLADLQAWQVERLTGCRVRDLSLYRAALTHKSALPGELRVTQSYERLEFLGDAVLSLACRTLLMERCPTSDEGDMTKLSSLLVSGASNARYAAFLGLDNYLVLDPRTLREGGQHTPHILADVYEALLGALYLDAGWAAAHTFCRRVLSACVDWSQVEADAEDWKGVFSRLASHQRRPQPRYRTTSTRKRQFRGGLQLKWYTVDVQYGGEVVGTGSGWERRWAEQAAARQALDNMGQLPGSPEEAAPKYKAAPTAASPGDVAED